MKPIWMLSIISIALAGCATPSAKYIKIDTPLTDSLNSQKIADSYYLNASAIQITPSKPKDATKPEPTSYALTIVPIDAVDFKVGVVPTSNFLKTTKINIVKVENSDRVLSIGVETTNNLPTFIGTVGGIIVQTLTMATAPGLANPGCRSDIDSAAIVPIAGLSKARDSAEVLNLELVPGDSQTRCVEVSVDAVPRDAIEIDKFPWGKVSDLYFYSACRSALVTVFYANGKKTQIAAKVADPRFVQFVQFPFKGSITMHSQCGVSVKTDASASPFGGLDAATEFLKQVNAIKSADK